MGLSLTICRSVRAHIIALILSALTAAVVVILVRAELVRDLSAPVECITSYRALAVVCLWTALGIRVGWLTCTRRLFAITSINWLGYRSPCRLLSFHLLMFRLRTGIGRFEVLQIGILGWTRWIVIATLVWVVVRVVQDDVWWQTFYYPFMLKSFIWSQPLFGIPFKASANEIDKWIVRSFS